MIEEHNLEEDSKWKKIGVGGLAIFLLILVTSYILASYPIFPIIASLSESQTANNKTINLDTFSIIFTENTYEQLQGYYYKDLSVEMVVCLKGVKGEDYLINEIYQPEIIEQAHNHVSFKPCSEDTLILLHSHPLRHCIASQQDLLTLSSIKEKNQNSIMVIMCEPDRFSVYR
jgi:hypothetical protein